MLPSGASAKLKLRDRRRDSEGGLQDTEKKEGGGPKIYGKGGES